MSLVSSVTCVIVALFGRAQASTPLIGIYPTMPMKDYLEEFQHWVEQFGARSVILPREGDADQWIQNISALLIPGGGGPVAPFAHNLVHRAVKANQDGRFFPVWGTCLGFEWILEIFAGHAALQPGFDADDLSLPLNFTRQSPGRLFGSANTSLMTWLSSDSITFNMHDKGIEPAHFWEDALSNAFELLATSIDRNGRPFVAAIEHREWPIYGVQFHPEKVRYSPDAFHHWHLHIPRGPKAIAASDHLANFFVAEASKASKTQKIHGPGHLLVV